MAGDCWHHSIDSVASAGGRFVNSARDLYGAFFCQGDVDMNIRVRKQMTMAALFLEG
jgi:hypothetical protein